MKFAERIVSPISSIIKASNNISKGSYDDKIKKNNDYVELNRLADSFNKMSSDIVKQKNQILVSKKHETWSDIARRIAHEIKNPLTPIQLSSERLEKKLKKADLKNKDIDECLQIIRRQVNENNTGGNKKIPMKERWSAKNFTLDKIFYHDKIVVEDEVELQSYHNISTWEGILEYYRSFDRILDLPKSFIKPYFNKQKNCNNPKNGNNKKTINIAPNIK